MEETLSLNKIIDVLKKRFLLIFSLVCGAALISGVVSYFVLTPTYQSSSQFIVNQNSQVNGEQVFDVNQIRSNVEIINTYNEIIKSPAILDQVVEETNLSFSAVELSEKLEITSNENSQVVTVTATDEDPQLAAAIANTTVNVFQNKIPDLMNVNNVSILSAAEVAVDPQPVYPNPLLNITIAIVLGAMFGVGVAFLLEYLDTTFNTEADVEEKIGLPVLGVVSHVREKDVKADKPAAAQLKTVRGGDLDDKKKKTV